MGVFTRDKTSPSLSPEVLPYATHRSLTAAAMRVNLSDKTQIEQFEKRRAASKWQDDAWAYYDIIGEIKYAFRLFSNVMSRIRLVPGYITDEDSPPVKIGSTDLDDAVKAAINKAMRRAFGPTAQADILRKAALNLLVTGECNFVAMPPKYGVREKEQWKILSVNELVVKNKKKFVRTERTQTRDVDMEQLPDSAFCGRIWVEHPHYSGEADSSMRALVDLCDDLMLYTRAARASARSRMNAGAFFVPDSMSVSADSIGDMPDDINVDPGTVAAVEDSDDDVFEQELLDSFVTPVSDESSAASVAPFIIRGPADDGAKLKHIKFDRPFDPQIAARAERALERILQGIDLPKDIVTGLANIKYSNAVQIEESLYTAHIEPLVLLLCDAFRAVYLVPALEAAGIDPDVIENVVVWYDPSAIMTAPDKANAANLGYDKMVLNGAAWRRANGFAESDAPTPQETIERIAIARGQLNDGVTETIFKLIAPDVFAQATAEAQNALPTGPYSSEVQSALGGTPAAPTPGATPPPEPGDAAAPPTDPSTLPPIVDSGGSTPTPPPS